MRLLLGPGEHYAEGWTNLDCAAAVANGIRADLIVDPAAPFGTFADGTAQRVYLGHVLEHIEWPNVAGLLEQVHRVLAPGGQVLVTGPDVFRSLDEWHHGLMPDELLHAVLEHADRGEGSDWPEAVHRWNCHEARVVGLLERAGFAEVTPTEGFEGWPVTNWSGWQCAVLATKA
jgi:predicted SAM-dependent methyltransferase